MAATVQYLQSISFSQLTLTEKIAIKTRGRPTPVLSIQQNSTSRNKEYTRQFNVNVYDKCQWLCGCERMNALFCFPCVLYGGDCSWTKTGVTDLRHLPQKVVKHEHSSRHMHNMVDLALLAAPPRPPHPHSLAKHNQQVRKNREVLSKIINCVKFCGKFEVPLRGGEEDPGVLVEFASELDPSFHLHLKSAPFFKGTSNSVLQNELLDSMLEICKAKIKEEVKDAEYLSVMCEETTDVEGSRRVVVVLRYVLEGRPLERFWAIVDPLNHTPQGLSTVLHTELHSLIGECPHKLVAQIYDGAAALTGATTDVHTRIKEVYTNAHFIHCYAHQLHLILEKATSQSTNVRVFFNSLSGIPAFFSKSPQRMAALDNVVNRRIPRSSATRWNFKSRTVNAVHEMKDALIECCSTLETSNSRETGSAAAGIKRILNDPDFEFWLEFFYKVMPHVDVLFSQLQSRDIDAAKVSASLKVFNSTVQKLRDECDTIVSPPEQKRRKFNTDRSAVAKEVCDVILQQCKDRFSFTHHLEASKLLLVNNFPLYTQNFPSSELAQAVAAYPMLDKDKLKTELAVLYTREDLCKSESLIDLLKILKNNNLQSTFSDTVKLLKILITIPMITAEADRCFSTLKRIRKFLRNTTVNDRLSALAMISVENEMIIEMKDFNEKVINHFAASSRHTDFDFSSTTITASATLTPATTPTTTVPWKSLDINSYPRQLPNVDGVRTVNPQGRTSKSVSSTDKIVGRLAHKMRYQQKPLSKRNETPAVVGQDVQAGEPIANCKSTSQEKEDSIQKNRKKHRNEIIENHKQKHLILAPSGTDTPNSSAALAGNGCQVFGLSLKEEYSQDEELQSDIKECMEVVKEEVHYDDDLSYETLDQDDPRIEGTLNSDLSIERNWQESELYMNVKIQDSDVCNTEVKQECDIHVFP